MKLGSYYLKSDSLWLAFKNDGAREHPLEHPPTVSEAVSGVVFARLVNGFERFVETVDDRMKLRLAIIARYFPSQLETLISLFTDQTARRPSPVSRLCEEGPEVAGRNPAFRRKVLEIYDYQCAACGLRIKLPDAELTFVDGAHLMPFAETGNDHPSNGIALCKNHHWAMDRFLLVPNVEGLWKVSPLLDRRRSPGENALMQLDGEPLLPPHDDAFLPAKASLLWRFERMLS